MPRRKRETDVLALTAEYRPAWLDTADRRRGEVRSVITARQALVRDLGGDAALSTQQFALLDRVTFFLLRVAELERRVLAGEDIDWGHYGYVSNLLLGHLKTLGLERKARSVGSLQEYIAKADQ